MTIPAPPAEGVDPWFPARNAFDLAVKADLEDRLSDESLAATIDARTGMDVIAVAGQSLAGGTGATADPTIDYDFAGLYWWGATPGSPGYHQINPFTYLPLAGGLIEARSYGLMGSLVTARVQYLETGRPQLIVPVMVGGMGFYSYNTVRGSWLVGGRTDGSGTMPNAAQISTDEINLALEAARELGAVRDFSIIWNQGEADRDVSTTETNYATALDALIAKWRADLDLGSMAATFPVVVSRQLPERRSTDGPSKAGVDNAQLATPGRLPYTAVMHPPMGYEMDGTHANAQGQRIMGSLYREAIGRARLNRPSMAATPVLNLKVSDAGKLTWDSPASGRRESFSVRYRTSGGAWSSAQTVRAGEVEYTPTGVPTGSVVEFEVTTVATTGNSLPATVKGAIGTPDITTGLLFDFNADSLTALADGASVAANNWAISAGSLTGLAFSSVGGTAPIVKVNDAALPGKRLVRFTSGVLATAAATVNIVNGTYVLLMRVRAATGSVQNFFSGSGGGEHVIFSGGTATTIAARTGSSGGSSVPSDLGNWIAVVVTKNGTTMSIAVETVAGIRSENTAEVAAATQTLLSLSNGTSTRASADYHRVMGFSRVLNGIDINQAIQSVFTAAGLR